MSAHIGIGYSQNSNPETALKQALFEAKTNLNQNTIDFAFILYTESHPPEQFIKILNATLHCKKIVGTSTAGIIINDNIFFRGIAIMLIYSEDWHIITANTQKIDPHDRTASGNQFAQNCLKDFGYSSRRQGFFFFTDGSNIDQPHFLKGIQTSLGNSFKIIGAGSCDNFQFKKTPYIYHKNILKEGAVSFMFGGKANIGIGGQHGWKPLGKPRIITGSQDNIVNSIDRRPARDFLQSFFEDETELLDEQRFGKLSILYPLGISLPFDQKYLLRNIVDIHDDGSIVCQGDVPEGFEVHIMISNKESCREAAELAATQAVKNLLGEQAKLVLVFESMARLKLFGRDAYKEIQEIRKVVGSDVPLFGMYTNGEIFPFKTFDNFDKSYFQNESIVVTAVS